MTSKATQKNTPFVNTYFKFQGCSLKFYPSLGTKYVDMLYVLAMLFHKERFFQNAFGFRSLHMLYTNSVTLYDNPIIFVLYDNVLTYSYGRKIALSAFQNMNPTRRMKTYKEFLWCVLRIFYLQIWILLTQSLCHFEPVAFTMISPIVDMFRLIVNHFISSFIHRPPYTWFYI